MSPQASRTAMLTPLRTAFHLVKSSAAHHTASATPLPRPDSMKHFFVDNGGVVRYSIGAPADASSTPA